MRLLFVSIFLLATASRGILANVVEDKKYLFNLCKDNFNKIEGIIEVNEKRSATDDTYIQEGIEALRNDITDCSNREDIRTINNELNSLKEIYEQNKAQEEIKSFIKTLVVELKNEILSAIKKPQNCDEVSPTDKVIKVYPFKGNYLKPVDVLCDQTTDGGGWTVIQTRDALPVREKFERGWNDYVKGFGDLNGEFWLGLDNIHVLTNSTPMELRVNLEDYDGAKRWAKYDLFRIGDAYTKYVLTLGNYSGDAGDSLTYPHNGMKFSTFDQDNDKSSNNCALKYRGGWWYKGCHYSNLNGYQYVGKHNSSWDGILWYDFRGTNYTLKKANMKIRPKSFN